MRHFLLAHRSLALAALATSGAQQPAANETAAPPTKGQGRTPGFQRESRARGRRFNDPDGKPVQLANFKGKPLLVNLWASWCAPCVKELPTLDKLARASNVQVLPVSQDDGPHASVVAFLKGTDQRR